MGVVFGPSTICIIMPFLRTAIDRTKKFVIAEQIVHWDRQNLFVIAGFVISGCHCSTKNVMSLYAQKKCPHVVHFNVPRDWFETNSWHQKCYSEGGKKFLGVAAYWEE